jgi:hypothetical protein
MLPIRANANVNINENKPSDAREVLAYYNRENMVTLYFMVLSTLRFCSLDKDNPYLDKAPNYERNYKTGKYRL